MPSLLPFHKSILEDIHDPATSDLLVLARGLGLRRLVCTLLQVYDAPQNLVVLVNAAQDEEAAIGDELGTMGCRNPGLRIVGYEMARKDRCVRRDRKSGRDASAQRAQDRTCTGAAAWSP